MHGQVVEQDLLIQFNNLKFLFYIDSHNLIHFILFAIKNLKCLASYIKSEVGLELD